MPIKKYLLAGLLVWTPLAITVAVLSWLVGSLDGAFIGALNKIYPLVSHETVAWLAGMPGLGVILMFLGLLLTGALASNVVGRWWLRQWDKLIAINLTGALHMHHAVLPGMVARKSGRIVNIASDAARVGSSGEAVYAACKGGLVAFSKTIAREHARHNVNVNVVCPGPTDTALFADYKEGAGNPEKLMEAFTRSIPLGRIGQPDDLPGAILFFASDDARYVTGQVLSVSGGLTMNG